MNILLRSSPLREPPLKSLLKALSIEDPACSPSWEHTYAFLIPLFFPPEILLSPPFFLSSKVPFFRLCSLFPETISFTTHFFDLYDFLNKLFLIVWVLALNSFLARTQVPRLLNPGPIWLHQYNTWYHLCLPQNNLSDITGQLSQIPFISTSTSPVSKYLLYYLCSRQLDRHEQSRNDRPGMEYYQGRNPHVPSKGQNCENKALDPRVTFSPLAYHWSCCLVPLTCQIANHVVQMLPWPFLPWHVSYVVDSLREGTKGPENSLTRLP